jgi:dolichyl-phosphate-mannose--protein O-mannosyl transferase
VAFYYYYYPAGMMLALALGYVFAHRRLGRYTRPIGWAFAVVSLGLFVYFFPILAALRIPSESFSKWMWLRRWI